MLHNTMARCFMLGVQSCSCLPPLELYSTPVQLPASCAYCHRGCREHRVDTLDQPAHQQGNCWHSASVGHVNGCEFLSLTHCPCVAAKHSAPHSMATFHQEILGAGLGTLFTPNPLCGLAECVLLIMP
jgi:hypothetical protein